MELEKSASNGGKASRCKHDQILCAAAKLFMDQGYSATSMDAVAALAQVSKATLYAHFKSKQVLFESMVQERFRAEIEESLIPSLLGDDPVEGLAEVGRRFLSLLVTPTALATFKLVLAESQRLPELGEAFFRSGPERTFKTVTSYMEHLSALGRLKLEDTDQATDQFLGLLKNKSYLKCLLGLTPPPTPQEIDATAKSAARLFFAAHKP